MKTTTSNRDDVVFEMAILSVKNGHFKNPSEFIAAFNRQLNLYGTVWFDRASGRIIDGKDVEWDGEKAIIHEDWGERDDRSKPIARAVPDQSKAKRRGDHSSVQQ